MTAEHAARRRRRPVRRLALAAAALAAIGIAVAVGLLLTRQEKIDPFRFKPEAESQFTGRAAAGQSHLLYTHSPGGALATARRVSRLRPQVQRAATASGTSADLIEAMIFLESGGRPDAVAGRDPAAATGLTQIVAETGRSLLGLHVDVRASGRLTRQIALARKGGQRAAVAALEARRRRVDERFDPSKSIAATGRYLAFARPRFGRDDFAVTSYHMGVGNLADVIRAYVGPREQALAIKLVKARKLTYAQVYFDSTPFRHRTAYRRLAALGDNSNTYLWRVLAAADIMRLYRRSPGELRRRQALETAKGSAEEVLRPPGTTSTFKDASALKRALRDGVLVRVANDPKRHHFRLDPASASLVGRLGGDPALHRALRPDALAVLYFIGDRVHASAHARLPLVVADTVRDAAYESALRSRGLDRSRGYSTYTTGFAFDVLRRYASRRQAEAFQAVLDRLQSLDVIAWERTAAVIHITVSERARALRPLVDGAKLAPDAY